MADQTFAARLAAAQAANGSRLALGLAPALDRLPMWISRHDEPFLPLGKAIIEATGDLVCAYFFHLAAYLSTGAAGVVALERTLAYVPRGVVKVLHGPFASGDYARAAFEEALHADAVTLATARRDAVQPYLAQAGHGALIMAETADAAMLAALSTEFGGQVGTIQQAGPERADVSLADASLRWCWGALAFPSRGADFAEATRAAALALRQAAL
jgi:orotidine-5'-phosphate decarboxylase